MVMEREGAARAPGDTHETTPRPDPTALTTQQLLREIGSLRELLMSRLTGYKSQAEVRFDAMDKAIKLIQSAFDKVPTEADVKVGFLRDLHAEKFSAVAQQFQERDTRTAETAGLNKLAIDAALQAAKEAVGKTEAAFTKSIDQLQELLNTTAGALDGKITAAALALDSRISAGKAELDGKISANKERLDRIEGQNNGGDKTWGIMVALGSLAIGVVIIGIRLLAGP